MLLVVLRHESEVWCLLLHGAWVTLTSDFLHPIWFTSLIHYIWTLASEACIVSFRYVLEACDNVVGNWPDEIANILKSRSHILSYRRDVLRDRISTLDVFGQEWLPDLFKIETKASDFTHNLIDLVFHLALCDSHAIDEHCIVYLLLTQPLIISLKVSLLILLIILSRLQTLNFIFPPLSLLLLFIKLSLKVHYLILKLISDFLGTLSLLIVLFQVPLKLLDLLCQIKFARILVL